MAPSATMMGNASWTVIMNEINRKKKKKRKRDMNPAREDL
jgi:hypothetical protein